MQKNMLRFVFAFVCIFQLLATSFGAIENGLACTKRACVVDDDAIRFFVIGDWGGHAAYPYYTVAQKQCADIAYRMSEERNTKFVISTGDNFYPEGVTDVTDPRFDTTFNRIYSFGKQDPLPWYMTAGNHDWFGNISAQIAYTFLNDKWVYPDYFYTVAFDARKKDGPSVEFIYIDTIVLCGNTWDGDINPDTGLHDRENPKRKVLPGPKDPEEAEKKWKWIEQQFERSKADYLFAVGHYQAVKKQEVNKYLMPRLQDLMVKYNVTGYIHGHEHNLAHITMDAADGHKVHYIESGAAHLSKPGEPLNISPNPWNAQSHFVFPLRLNLTEKRMNNEKIGGYVNMELHKIYGVVGYWDCKGELLYSFEINPRPAASRK